MTHVLQSISTHTDGSAWWLWFAKEPDQDLELEEGFDDFDDGHPKPPSRRPLLIILLLLLVAGGAYFAMNPDLLSSLKNMIAAPGSYTADEQALNGSPESSPTSDRTNAGPPSPIFHEGEVVSVVAKMGDPSPITLSRDAQGTELGPKVKTGELLTVVDGAFIKNTWMYLVNTKSGAKGWISEHQIRSQS